MNDLTIMKCAATEACQALQHRHAKITKANRVQYTRVAKFLTDCAHIIFNTSCGTVLPNHFGWFTIAQKDANCHSTRYQASETCQGFQVSPGAFRSSHLADFPHQFLQTLVHLPPASRARP